MPRSLTLSALLLIFLSLTACAAPAADGVTPAAPTITTREEDPSEAEAAAQPSAATTATATPPGAYPAVPHTPAPPATTSAYPAIDSYPDQDGEESVTRTPETQGNLTYLPFAGAQQPAAATSEAPIEPTPEPVPTLDFAALRSDLEAQGEELTFVKTGFHVTLPEDRTLLDGWMTRLDAAGVPIFIKTVDNAEPLYKAQELMRKSGVPHVLVFRATGGVPHYELPPQQAAQIHWEMHRDLFPPELDPSLVWVETLNEPDRTNSEWLAEFALETARLAMADGFRWAAFGWASGEPEPEHWQGPKMQEFLRLAGENPDKIAIALHEYSYLKDEIGHEYPYKIGRFQELFRIVDELGIPRPTVLITEWGWEHNEIPAPERAIKDLRWVAELYAAYPQVKGAAIWNLGIGCCFGDISEQVQEIIEPVTELSLTTYFAKPPGQQAVDEAKFQP